MARFRVIPSIRFCIRKSFLFRSNYNSCSQVDSRAAGAWEGDLALKVSIVVAHEVSVPDADQSIHAATQAEETPPHPGLAIPDQ